MMRIGYGFDVHRLVPGRPLILCGVKIGHTMGLLGHSDADAAAHALMDALLGALALGDIGMMFPDNDPAYAGADSMALLRRVLERPEFAEWRIANADITIAAQQPKLAPYRDRMRASLAAGMGIDITQVSVKATTTEKLGYEGREEGISAVAAVLLEKR